MARLLRTILTSLALLLTLASTIITLIIGYPTNLSKTGISTYQAFALIDAKDIHTTVGNPPISYQGLPDSHFFNRHQDFFALYVHRYCSGQVDGKTGIYRVDFCSEVGSELFDQQRVWRVWGVDLGVSTKKAEKVKRRDSYELEPRNAQTTNKADPASAAPPPAGPGSENYMSKSIGVSSIKIMPRAIFGCFMTTAVLLDLTLLFSLLALCTHFAKYAALGFAVLGTIGALLTASLSQIFFPTLVRRVHGYQVVAKNGAGGGVLTSKLGTRPLAGLWILAVLSLISMLLLAGVLHSHRREKKSGYSSGSGGNTNGKDKDSRLKEYNLSPTAGKTPNIAVRDASPIPGLLRRATNKMFGSVGIGRYDDTSYETLRVVGAEPRGRSRSPARSRDPSRVRASTVEEKGKMFEAGGSGSGDEERASRYEPYRHQSGP